ncbi:CdaR family transcriptional regulator [Sodalis ligni]|uniref:Sugar diacid utilization regulator n=1 Tax=Sodalis ligni TaxID=2697027 RepID=A0A4V2Q2M2_9GAMM|nr:sugar diacid recognition domain-containing protein [Sodalis ligni]TCL03388.1 sugar diacid utilization regulator [Sodalis ligni]
MLITTVLANEIVSRAMAIIHHNVNVINNDGIIIASGERHRIGEQHEIACEVIRTGKRIIIQNAAEAACFQNVHPGINHPIMLDGRVAMVIGISGDPIVINRYAELAILTAELLVRQAQEMRDMNWRQRLRDTLFSQYLEAGDSLAGGDAFIRLTQLGFVLNIPLVPVVIDVNIAQERISEVLDKLLRRFSLMSPDMDVILLSSHEILVLLAARGNCDNLLNQICFMLDSQLSHYRIGVGLTVDAPESIREAIKFARSVIEVGSKVQPERQVYYFREMAVLCLFKVLENSYLFNFFDNIIKQLLAHDSGEMLLDTLDCFITHNAELGKTAHLLGIHRNTLTYRLQQIKKHLQLDPMLFMDLVQLSVSVYCYRKMQPRQSIWVDSLS